MPDPNALHRLIYCSRAFAETRDLDAHVQGILTVSIRNNQAANVTGMLLVHDGWFVQALEGAHVDVLRTYGRIACDRRHEGPRVLAGGPVASRAFGQWSMDARRLDRATAGRLARRRLPFDPTRLDGEAALALLSAAEAPVRAAA